MKDSVSEAPPPDGVGFCLTCAQVKTCVDPVTNCVRYHTPRGRFLHVPPAGPCSDWDSDIGVPWWADRRYEVGLLSAKTRWIRVVNTLTLQEQPLQVGGPQQGVLGKPVQSLVMRLLTAGSGPIRFAPRRLWMRSCSGTCATTATLAATPGNTAAWSWT